MHWFYGGAEDDTYHIFIGFECGGTWTRNFDKAMYFKPNQGLFIEFATRIFMNTITYLGGLNDSEQKVSIELVKGSICIDIANSNLYRTK